MEEKKDEKKKPKLSLIEQWELHGVPCKYVRFHQPVPPVEDSEPVSEFRLKTKNKYSVDSITYTEHGLIWRAKGEVDICALANVLYSRAILTRVNENGSEPQKLS
jgi:hypothetical protein